MRKRDLQLGKYSISNDRYRELYYFCMQYQEKKERIAKGDSDRTEQDINDIRIIEQVAAETCGKNRDFMIQYVATGGIPEKDIPLPIAIFREQRRNFFIRLSDEMERRDRDVGP